MRRMVYDQHTRSVLLRFNTAALALYILIFCIVAEITFVVLDYYINYSELVDIGAMRRMFNIAREDGLASWFGATQTLLAGLTLWLIYAVVKHQPGSKWRRSGWLILALFFTYMAVDDGAQLHERFGTTFKALREDAGGNLDYFPSYAWQVFFGPVFALLGLFLLGFLLYELDSRHDKMLVLLALSGLALAVALDFVEGLDEGHAWDLYTIIAERYDLEEVAQDRFGETAYDTLRHFSKSIEEAIEMLAISVLWFVFLRYLGSVTDEIRVRLDG